MRTPATRRAWCERYGLDGRGLLALVNAYHALCQYEAALQQAAKDRGAVSGGGSVDVAGITDAIDYLRTTYQDTATRNGRT